MKVLLIVPPFYRLWGGHNNWVMLGTGYVAAELKQRGYDVKVYNADHVENGTEINLRQVFSGTVDGGHRLAGHPKHAIWREIQRTVESCDPDVVGISVNYVTVVPVANRIAQNIKKWRMEVPVIYGGNNVTLMPEYSVAHDAVDFGITFEGEYPMVNLMDQFSGRFGLLDPTDIPNLVWKDGKHVHVNEPRQLIEDLDALPFPELENQLVPLKDVNNFGVVVTSRGCPYGCTFCSSPALWERRVRFRSVVNVVDEMEWRNKEYGVNRFYVNDDNFNIRRKRTIDLCEMMTKRVPDVEWICEAQLRNFDEQTLWAMKAAGCVRVKLGVESGNDRVLQLMKKPFDLATIREKIELVKRVGIPMTIYALIGYPTETREEMLETLRLMEWADPEYVSLSVAAPQPRTPLYDYAVEHGLWMEEDFFNRSHQSYRSALNPNVDQGIIDLFLDFNEKKNYARKVMT